MLSHFVSDFNKFNSVTNTMDVIQLVLKELRTLGYSKYFNLSDSLSLNKNTLFNLFLFLISGSFSIFYLFVYLNSDLARSIVKLALAKSLLDVTKLNILN